MAPTHSPNGTPIAVTRRSCLGVQGSVRASKAQHTCCSTAGHEVCPVPVIPEALEPREVPLAGAALTQQSTQAGTCNRKAGRSVTSTQPGPAYHHTFSALLLSKVHACCAPCRPCCEKAAAQDATQPLPPPPACTNGPSLPTAKPPATAPTLPVSFTTSVLKKNMLGTSMPFR